jgi:hypothetical protein
MVRAVDEPPPQGRLAFQRVERGVPKRPLPAAVVTVDGILGDAVEPQVPRRAGARGVALFARGPRAARRRPPWAPATGEPDALGLDWSRVVPGARLAFAGGVPRDRLVLRALRHDPRGFTAGRRSHQPGQASARAASTRRVLTTGTLSEASRSRSNPPSLERARRLQWLAAVILGFSIPQAPTSNSPVDQVFLRVSSKPMRAGPRPR